MPVEVIIVDSDGDFEAVARRMAQVAGSGSGGLRQRSATALDDSTGGLRRAVESEARNTLPKRGGLAARVARSRYRTRRRISRDPRVAFEATNDYDIRRIDAGTVRHPVFGRPDIAWVTQPVRRGFFTRPTERQEPVSRRALTRMMAAVARLFSRI